MFCQQCGTDVGDRAAFCYKCGARLNAPPQSPVGDRLRARREQKPDTSPSDWASAMQVKPIPQGAKDQAWKYLTEVMMLSLEHAQMTVKGSEVSAELMLQGFDPVKTVGEWQDFMGKLYLRFPQYKTVAGRLYMLNFDGAAAEVERLKAQPT